MNDGKGAPAGVIVRDAAKRYGNAVALDGVSLEVHPGEFLALLGPSGCGKTTLLRGIAGLVAFDAGAIEIDGQSVAQVPAWRRDVGVVFQSYALFPHLRVAENVAFGLRMRRLPADEIRRRVTDVLALVRLGEFARRYPAQLSGGQQQRVALARALVIAPKVLLLDEPLAALDAKLRTAMQEELRALQTRLGITAILVTHDQNEAMVVADRIAVMDAGRIAQIDSPEQIYRRPATPFVAGFVGEVNRFHGRIGEDGSVHLQGDGTYALRTAVAFNATPGDDVTIMIRPEDIRLAIAGEAGHDNGLTGQIGTRRPLGDRLVMNITTPFGDVRAAVLGREGENSLASGDRVRLSWGADAVFVFPGGPTSLRDMRG